MVILALAKLQHRSEKLRTKLTSGSATEIKFAREMLRLSLVELYELGHWRDRPEQLRTHMRLYRACETASISAPPSMSVPDRMDQCSP
jgi:hypothetical protein